MGNIYLEELKHLELAKSHYESALTLLQDRAPPISNNSSSQSEEESEPLIKEGNVCNALSEVYRQKASRCDSRG